MSKTWFITGASRGFGRSFAAAALGRGDRVAATVRDLSSLDDLAAQHGDALLPIELDVTDRAAGMQAVADAHARLGHLDVVVNNAGYGHFGTVEELTEDEIRRQMETNFFGALWITQAAIPLMRDHGSGHVVQVSSIGGVAAFPGIGAYHASKWALEGLSEALAQEVSGFGIHVTIVEPSGFSTDWSGDSSMRSEEIEAYDPVREVTAKRRGGSTSGDPDAAAASLLQVVDAEEPPLRVLFGGMANDVAPRLYAGRLETWKAWEQVGRDADG
jgi:NAD(P)-dependent dehydrogenase (short-subunit alcohol dehydrogenase family)